MHPVYPLLDRNNPPPGLDLRTWALVCTRHEVANTRMRCPACGGVSQFQLLTHGQALETAVIRCRACRHKSSIFDFTTSPAPHGCGHNEDDDEQRAQDPDDPHGNPGAAG